MIGDTQQSQLDRVCTLEATALLFSELLGPAHPLPTRMIDVFKTVVLHCMKVGLFAFRF